MSDREHATVLIVEDNPLTIQVLIEYLKKSGITTPIARGGEEALRLVGLDKPDLILLDIMLPGMDGFETCRRLKSNVTTKDIPVIFMTALTETAHKVHAFEVGGADYITKPFDFKEVAVRVNTRLSIQKLQRRLQAQNAGLTSSPTALTRHEKGTIAIVEDNPMTLQLMLNYLKGLGFETIGFPNGEEMLQHIEARLPDLILLDVMLPGLDGFETCRRLKRNPAAKEIPVIFMTALSDMGDKVRAFDAGGTDYIAKPHQYAEVVARIDTHLTLRTLQRQLQKQRDQREKR